MIIAYNNCIGRFLILFLGGLLASCALEPAYISVMGADESDPDKVAYVVNSNRSKEDELWLYAVDGTKVSMEPFKREHYAISPGSHTLWVLAPMAMPVDPLFMESHPNRCFVFEVDLVAGKTYFLVPFENTKVAKLVRNDREHRPVHGKLVDESWWTCYWDK